MWTREHQDFGPNLTRGQVEDLLREGTPEARAAVLGSYLGWIRINVNKILTKTRIGKAAQNRFDHFEDAEQEARMAVYKCTETFDPDVGITFTLWATRPLRWAVIKYLSELGGPVAVPGIRSANNLCDETKGAAMKAIGSVSSDKFPGLMSWREADTPPPNEEVENNDLTALVEQQLAECIRPEYAEAIRQQYYEDKTLREIEETSDITREGIRWRRNEGLHALSFCDELRDYWEGDQ